MKKIHLLLAFIFYGFSSIAQNPDAFIMTFEVTNDPGLNITVPIVQDSTNNYTIDFGDGTILTNQTGNVSHTYSTVGTYTVSLTGTFGHIKFSDIGIILALRLKAIEQWGSNQWTSMENAFSGCSNLIINAIDIPNLSQVTNMSGMFKKASSLNQPLNNWDVSNITDMSGMFKNASSFNQPLNNWNISNVTVISDMFAGATSFNQPLNSWDVSSVTNMSFMFSNAVSFNQPLNNWDVSNVTGMIFMFYIATSFNQDLSNWSFNENVSFDNFLSYSGLDTNNYDAVFIRFAQLQLEYFTFFAYGMKYCDINVRNYLINELGWNIYADSLGENCGNNHIIGSIIYDENNNGCDTDDLTMNNIWITASNDPASSTTLSVNEEYILNVYEGTHIISLNVPNYFSYSPVNPIVSFTGSDNVETLNFCLTANQTVQDLNITLLPITPARPGFEADYQIIVQNIGTQTVNNISVSFTFDDTKQSFVSAVPSPSSTTANQLNFDIAGLSPFSSIIINFTMQTFTPPTVNSDDILSFSAAVSPSIDDYTPYDNAFGLRQIVVNSYDPNDKQVLQGSEIHIDNVNEYLHYLIRFQNTGTASAINVRIEDELHESLDWNTIQILNSSHNYRVEIKDGNQVAFIFNNINLPYEDEDEEGSNGFIAYKIKPIAGLEVGDIITGNEAYIYFDYNLPIITNSTETEIVQPTSSVSQHNLNNLISVYPNPTNGILHISSKENIIIEEVKIYNLQGRELFGSVQHLETISIENLSAGIYLMNIKTNQGVISKKVIKK
ncbi:MAG: BspA family leucine-rich repeat surface protein [Flavobacteriaceae bacterium]